MSPLLQRKNAAVRRVLVNGSVRLSSQPPLACLAAAS